MNTIPKWLTALALLSGSVVANAQDYTVTDLGTLGGSISGGSGINSSGQVAGYSYTRSGAEHAFLYTNGTMHDLGTLGGTLSIGLGINDSGQVTGYSYTMDNGELHAFVYSNGTIQDLGTLGGSVSIGEGINANGQVVGYSVMAGSGTPYAVIFSKGTVQAIGAGDSQGGAINSSGQVAGDLTAANGKAHAFLYSSGTTQDLGTLPGSSGFSPSSAGAAINHSAQVTGDSTSANGLTHAFLYSNGSMQDLGTLGGELSIGLGINDSGRVVGGSETGNGSVYHAFLYSSGQMVDLNVEIGSAAALYTLTYGVAINNDGQILANGVVNATGDYHAFLLTPNTPLTLACPAGTAQVGVAYSSAMPASGGVLPYKFSNTGNLPGGLTLNKSTGGVTGTPTTAGTFSFTAQVVDSSGLAAGTVTASCTIMVRPAPNFSISASPASLSIVQGSAGTSLITTNALYGFAGEIQLQQSGAPTGTSVTFTPTSVSAGGTSAMRITVGSSTAVGTYSVVVSGMSGALSHTTTLSLTVSEAPLKLTVTPSRLSFGTVRQFSVHFRSITLQNTGTKTVSISTVSVTPSAGTDRHAFTPLSLCGRTLDPGRRCEILVVLFADLPGSLSATLNIPNDALAQQHVSLSAAVIERGWNWPLETHADQP
jgi:probable HAF family extracellular repeat protein